jgi:hypothetical protein
VLKGECSTDDDKEHPNVPRALADELTGGQEAESPVHVKMLQDALFSKKLYTHPLLYAKWAGGFESGLVKGTVKRSKPQPMAATITCAHEAHFRLEIYMALSRPSYTHPPGLEEAYARKKMWLKMCRCVKRDRAENGDTAHATRLKAFTAAGGDVHDAASGSDDDEDEFDADMLR